MSSAPARWANLLLRFLLELAALAAFGYWGWTIGGGWLARAAVAASLPATVAVIWATFISPKARIPTGPVGRALLGLVVFLLAAAALWTRDQHRWAMVYGSLAVISSALMLVWPGQDLDGFDR